ncbi:sulfotransferase family protein [Pseudoalteromonas shioyasakiensis]|uniref:sulfotransferase n=1 Tax=Pseudoalteromonas shioyasakiensis TaxID=1190813 RepID=UPI0021196D01|nr:sulfotransferase [Pseudoalteromonas shioyasakiensis]MCQ8876722.1 sulfotransferase family protein [Pseudoalteromonas shioyasakiensis]
MTVNKIFIIGLPRTGTTSVCHSFLQLGYTCAHTAYTKQCFTDAQVIADTPIFNDYQYLDTLYPGSKFIYLQRSMDLWLPSIRQLLSRMFVNLTRADGGFNPHIKRCYLNIFKNFSAENIANDAYLEQSYSTHLKAAEHYFEQRQADFLKIDISDTDSFIKLCDFLHCATPSHAQFEKMNIGGKVTAWNAIKHPLKIASTASGKIDKVIY